MIVGAAVSLRQLDAIESFSERADLVNLDQDRISDPELDSLLKKLSVGDKEIVADELHSVAELIRQQLPTVPIVFRHAVFDGDDRILVAPALPVRDHLFAAQFSLIALFEDVFPAVVKLARSRIQREQTIRAGCVSCLSIDSRIVSTASSFDFKFGAKPPSSPTLVA